MLFRESAHASSLGRLNLLLSHRCASRPANRKPKSSKPDTESAFWWLIAVLVAIAVIVPFISYTVIRQVRGTRVESRICSPLFTGRLLFLSSCVTHPVMGSDFYSLMANSHLQS